MSWLMAGATLGAGALSSAGQLAANQQNINFTQGINDVQTELANTAHQREVRDLIASGLNPILSAHGSGAAVPSLGGINSQNAGQGLADGISSATRYGSSQYRAQVDNIRASTNQTNTINSALKADREVADIERNTDKMLVEARFDAARRLTGHEDKYKNGKHITTFNQKTYDDYVDSLVSGMKSAQHRQNWQGFQSWLPFINGGLSGLNSAVDAHQKFKYTRRFFK